MPELHVACTRPGMIRGGVHHPAHRSYALNHFSAAQLADMAAEPEIVLLVGDRITPENVGAFCAVRAPAVDAPAADAPPPTPANEPHNAEPGCQPAGTDSVKSVPARRPKGPLPKVGGKG